MKYLYILFGIIALITFFAACSKDSRDYQSENDQAILDYLTANNIDATPTGSGLYYRSIVEGNGDHPNISNNIVIYYRGYTIGGQQFDAVQPPQDPISFPLQNLIAGWQEGIPLMSVGGEAQLFIPAHLAYGSGSPSSNGVIIFDIQLMNFN